LKLVALRGALLATNSAVTLLTGAMLSAAVTAGAFADAKPPVDSITPSNCIRFNCIRFNNRSGFTGRLTHSSALTSVASVGSPFNGTGTDISIPNAASLDETIANSGTITAVVPSASVGLRISTSRGNGSLPNGDTGTLGHSGIDIFVAGAHATNTGPITGSIINNATTTDDSL
jgi:hypothetical protein